MITPLFVALPGNEAMAARLAASCGGEILALEMREFPDGESYLRFTGEVTGRDIVLVCTLAHPNEKVVPMLFAAAAARDLGAYKVGLVAPYLCYMRQDRRFHPGEAITSRSFATLISSNCDWLVTIDPHLHRYRSLDEIYSIPSRALHAGPAIAGWIKTNVEHPFLVGPDLESEQWVGAVARACGAEFAVLRKERLADRQVRISPDHLDLPKGATPVLLDDIVSSGETLIEALRLLSSSTRVKPVAIAVHGLFAAEIADRLRSAGARLVTSNSVPNPAGLIDITALMTPAIRILTSGEDAA